MRRLAAVPLAVVPLLGFLVAPDACRGEERVLFSYPLFDGQPSHRIVSVDAAKREVVVAPVDRGGFMTPTEGPGILVVPSRAGGSPDTAVRIEVAEILDDGSLRATFGQGAVEIVAKGPALVARPFAGDLTAASTEPPRTASTKALRALPDVVRPPAPAPAAAGPAVDAVAAARAAARRMVSIRNLKSLALAFHNYHDTYGRFPPAAVVGPDGRPWHSWRILILPFLEEVDLHKRYDFGQPWDAPANLAVAEKMPKVFQDPIAGVKDGSTCYAVLVGDATLFPPDENPTMAAADDTTAASRGGPRLAEVTDGTSNTIMIATVDPARKIPWTKPEDIVVGPDGPSIGTPDGIAALHRAGAGRAGLVAIADGSVRALAEALDRETLTAITTRNGGEVVDHESLAVEGIAEAGGGMRAMKIVAGADGTPYLDSP